MQRNHILRSILRFVKVVILVAVWERFAMTKMSAKFFDWKYGLTHFSCSTMLKTIDHHHCHHHDLVHIHIKDKVLVLRQFLETGSSFKRIKNDFDFS